jgi:hypothetical protein
MKVEILGKTYTQEEEDDHGKSPTFPIGTRIVFCPDKDDSKEGEVLLQKQYLDGGHIWEWGNVIVKMDDGRYIEANSFQCREVGKPHMWDKSING